MSEADKDIPTPKNLPFFRRIYYPGQRIFSQGEPGKEMYYVERGRVRIWRGIEEPGETITEVIDGGLFGEMALIDNRPRMAHATAMFETVIQTIPADVVKNKLAHTDVFIRRLVKILSQNLRNTMEPSKPLPVSPDHHDTNHS